MKGKRGAAQEKISDEQNKRFKLEKNVELVAERVADIKLTDVLSIEHAVISLQNSILKIIKELPNFQELIETIQSSDTEDLSKKEIFIALTRSNNVKLASLLKKLYDENKLPIFDQILKYNEAEELSLSEGSISLNSVGDSTISTLEKSALKYKNLPYPPPLPKINDPVILSRVFMHKSVVNDKTYLTQQQAISSHNERLEFLGDSILNNLITLIIFEMFPHYTEGELSKLRILLVNNHTLTDWSKLYGLDKELIKNITDTLFQTGKMKVYADVFELYIGGLVMDNVEMLVIREWLKQLAKPILDRHVKKKSELTDTQLNKNAKLELYSLIGCAAMPPRYEVVQIGDGVVVPFIVQCLIKDEQLGRGSGQNIKEAGLRLAMALLLNKELIEKYSLIRRQMPRSVSVMRLGSEGADEGKNKNDGSSDSSDSSSSSSDSDSENDSSDSDSDKDIQPATVPSKANTPELSLPIRLKPIPEHLIDIGSKERLYTLLGKKRIIPEYDSERLKDGQLRVMLSINNVPFVESIHRNIRLAGQRAAQYLLENPKLLRDHGLMD